VVKEYGIVILISEMDLARLMITHTTTLLKEGKLFLKHLIAFCT